MVEGRPSTICFFCLSPKLLRPLSVMPGTSPTMTGKDEGNRPTHPGPHSTRSIHPVPQSSVRIFQPGGATITVSSASQSTGPGSVTRAPSVSRR